MRYSVIFFLLFIFIPFFSNAQPNEVLVTIGDSEISKSEFEWAYIKNNTNLINDSEKKTPEEYLELFINFKLKVLEAKNLRLDTGNAFINEISGYRDELAEPYLTDITFNEDMEVKMYERLKTEIKASHILIEIENNQNPSDTLQAYNKILNIRNEIINGKSFQEAATQYSNDPSAKINNGDLGYFTAFQMIYPFENAAYETPVGEICMPIKSSFGYHLIKIKDKRAAKGKIKVAHIMKSFPENATANQKASLKNEIDSIYTILLQGADFKETAKKYSDDKSTSDFGGELTWFSSGDMIDEFAIPAFSLTKNNDFTQPILTPYGYHIIKRIEYSPIASFEELKPEIEKMIINDPERSNHNKEIFLNKLKNEYSFEILEGKLENILAQNTDFSEFIGNEQVLSESILFKLNGNSFNAFAYFGYLRNKFVEINSDNIRNSFNDWVNDEIISYEKQLLEKKYPEFKYIMQEYHDGILLFNLSDKKIWSFAIQDTLGLKDFYGKNKEKYLWGERFKGFLIKCNAPQTRKIIENLLSEKSAIEDIKDALDHNGEKIDFEEGIWEKGSNPIVDYFIWGQQKPDGLNEELYFIRGTIIDPEPKNLEQAKGLYISDYQKYLEEKWVKELKEKYPVKINKKVLRSIENV